MKTRFLIPALLLFSVPALAAVPGELALVNRLSWGETAQGDTLGGQSPQAWLTRQLHPGDDDGLPPQVQAQIAAMEISQKNLVELNEEVRDLRQQLQAAKGTPDGDAARKTYQQKLNELSRQAQARSLLRDLYSKNQLKEQLTWFWFNHFNVHAQKGEIRAMVGDYEDTLRAHALGRFSDLLAATVIHPAMLQYLDNAQNAVGKINENYAREIMELHTLGVGSGYSQQDVQELARILTGLGVNLTGKPPGGRPVRGEYHGEGLTLFNPNRHDFGDKTFLGTAIQGDGVTEISKAIAILAAEPPTAHFVSKQLAQYFCCDAPSDRLVNAMAATWKRSDGDIADVLATLFASPEFKASLGQKFKDPMHYAVSAVRAAYGDRAITNTQPMIGWLNRMGEPLYGHETPDGYPLTQSAWSGPGQMETRFEIARQIGYGAPQLFLVDDPSSPPGAPPVSMPHPPPPVLQQTSYYTELTPALSPATAGAISQGATQGDRNMLLLSSPEFMKR
jgi:uncharacterized protein (DUF1800 family)